MRPCEVAIRAHCIEPGGDQGDGEETHTMPPAGAGEGMEGGEGADLDCYAESDGTVRGAREHCRQSRHCEDGGRAREQQGGNVARELRSAVRWVKFLGSHVELL